MMSLHSWHRGATKGAGIGRDIYERIPSGSVVGICLDDLLIYLGMHIFSSVHSR